MFWDGQWLRFCNQGLTDYQALTLLGCSTSRDDDRTIGSFGSGAKNSVCLLLRNDIKPVICIGNLKVEYTTKTVMVNNKPNDQIVAHLSGRMPDGSTVRRTEDQNMTTDFGIKDWSDLNMACREFCANMLDGAITHTGTHKTAIVDIADSPRCKAGHTQVFIPLTPEIKGFLKTLGERFLHFSDKYTLDMEILKKDKPGPCIVYHKGVKVKEVGTNSVFDYNVSELKLDECRNCNSWDIHNSICKTLAKPVNKSYLKTVLRRTAEDSNLLESQISQYIWEYHKEELATAFEEEFPGMVISSIQTIDHISKKGFEPIRLAAAFDAVLRTIDRLKTDSKILSKAETEGFVVSAPTDVVIKARDMVWDTLTYLDLTCGKEKPEVFCIFKPMSGETKLQGLCDGSKVFVDRDLGGIQLVQTMVEEVSHYCSGETDGSRGFQDYAFLAIAKLIS